MGGSAPDHPLRDCQGVRAVVFDLGGVLVQLGGVEEMAELCGGIGLDELWDRWLSCRWVRAFERGWCTGEEFAAGVVEDWQLPLDPDAFLASFRGWPLGLEPAADSLVAQVNVVATTACLSNTNPVHWEGQIERGFGLETMFDHRFLSHELGMVKPDAEIFAHVTQVLDLPPSHLLFLDDNARNVAAAHAAGWVAERVRGPVEAQAALERHGVPVT
jgi:putative hydrolase of the HAD superfamily